MSSALDALRLPTRRARRWWVAAGLSWVAGSVGGVAPAAFLGDPTPGAAASFVLGAVAVGLLSPLIVTPVMATIVADDDRTQLASALHLAGVSSPLRLVARAGAIAEVGIALVIVGGVAGMVSGLGSSLRSVDGFSLGLRSAPTVAGVLAGASVVPVAWGLALLVAVAAVTPARAVIFLALSFLATGVVASLVYFVPGLRPVFWCTPWAGLWPFDPESFDSAQFAASIPVAVRIASGAGWLTVVGAMAARRLALAPFPSPADAASARGVAR